jgi:methylmalonyl-CoA mutase cobalamin-binding domain/chain
VVVAGPGLDGRHRGAESTALALRDAGFEVIVTGLQATAEAVVETVLQEDADAVVVALASGDRPTLVSRVVDGLRHRGLGDVPVVVDGAVPAPDVPALLSLGVGAVTSEPQARMLGARLSGLLAARESGEVAC